MCIRGVLIMKRKRHINQKHQQAPSRRPMGEIIAEAAGVNVNTVYTLSKYLKEYIEVKVVYPDGK